MSHRLTTVAVLFAVAIGSVRADAQEPAGILAYDYCQMYDWDVGIVCSVHLVAGDGAAYVGDGIDPAWSPDGSRIAFAGYNRAGIFIVNLADWSVVNLPAGGGSPAWSPDGLKLAFAAGELYVMDADGSDVVQLTRGVGFRGEPAWSPDGHTVAFDCEIEAGNRDICAIRADGSGLTRLTTGPAWDSGAAFSPDGFRIAFATAPPLTKPAIAVMNRDGTGRTLVAGGFQPAWSPDGTRLSFVVPFEGACPADGRICPDTIYTANADGADPRPVAAGNRPAWGMSMAPVAWILAGGCMGRVCDFDGSRSWGGEGGIARYAWNFGDGTGAIGPGVTHTYAASGLYEVTLTVTDSTGATGVRTTEVAVDNANELPIASFTAACSGGQCSFDGSGSVDPDGSIVHYSWRFGDGGTGGGPASSTAAHAYATPGVFTVTLIVTDDAGAIDEQQQSVTVAANVPPVAALAYACSGLTCTFDATGSSDADGTIASYGWSFGNGSSSSSATPKVTYAAAGTYKVVLTVTDNGHATSTEVASVTVSLLPPGWSSRDVGAVAAAGSSSHNAGTWTVSGSGADIWGTADELQFVSERIGGDVEIVARVVSIQNVNRWTKAGIMVRENLGAGARHALMLITPTTEKGTAFQRRPVANGESVSTAGPGITAPAWIKLVRRGDVVSAHYRKAATDLWTLVGRQTLTALARDLEVGLAVSSHVDGTLATATFDNVSVRRSIGWTSADVGAVGVPGRTADENGVLTVEASGADIWGAADAFRFVHEGPSTNADATITARVRSIEPTHEWAKAGVMMRERATPGSRHVMVIVSPGKGIVMQYRTVEHGASASTPARAGTAPKWVRLTRRGNTFIGETSSDGAVWIEIGRTTIPLASTHVGLAVTSHNNGTLATAAFDDVSIVRPF